jgi:HlyD family secretion protein
MNVTINRLDPNVPDPVESRRRAAGRLVRIAYATAVFGVVGFFVIYFGAPFVFLRVPAPFRPRGTSCHFRIPCRSPR